MELIERYLKAIEFWLPGGEKQDILAEISEDIDSQVEEHQNALGRTLTTAEVEALLKARGRPMLVANRYRPQRALIGPDWFPIYLFVLKIVGLCYVLPWMTIYFIIQRVEYPETKWILTFLASLGRGWEIAFFAAAAVTVIFGCLQVTEAKSHFLENWNPRELPKVRDPFKIRRFDSIMEIVVGVPFVLCWIDFADTLKPFADTSFQLTLNPIWFDFFWGYLLLAVFNILLAILNLRRPYWSLPRAFLKLLSDLAGGALFCWLLKANIVASIWLNQVDAAKTADIMHWIQFSMTVSFPVAVIAVTILIAFDAFRIFRVSRGPESFAGNGASVPAR